MITVKKIAPSATKAGASSIAPRASKTHAMETIATKKTAQAGKKSLIIAYLKMYKTTDQDI